MISPRNYFLFTPLLPSVAIGTLDARSIIQPTRYITRHKGRAVHVYEAEATEVDVSEYSVSLCFVLISLRISFLSAREQDCYFQGYTIVLRF